MRSPDTSVPIMCDMSNASDTDVERAAEYRRLFSRALVARERTAEGIRFRFRAEPGIESWVRDLAAREKACCAFFVYEIAADGDAVVWDAAVPDDDLARALLEEFYALPDTLAAGRYEWRERLADRGVTVASNPAGTVHHFQPAGADRIGG